MASEEQHAAAILALLTIHDANAYDIDDLAKMQTPPSSYTEFATSWRTGAEPRLCGSSGTEGYRFRTRFIAKTVSNARELQRRTVEALEEARIQIDGVTSTPIRRESQTQIAEDDQWFSGMAVWTYVIAKTRSTP